MKYFNSAKEFDLALQELEIEPIEDDDTDIKQAEALIECFNLIRY